MPIVLRSYNGSLLPYFLNGYFLKAGTTTLIADGEKCGDQVSLMKEGA